MRAGGPGLHRGGAYGDCVDCHVEHQGRDYALVYWPTGQEGFDHGQTGYRLEGGHARVACRGCHTATHVADPAPLRAADKDLDRTFLGLGPGCTTCHADPHAGQFAADCTSCHDTGHWRPAPLFDHERTPYPLTGRHAAVDCAKCHPPASQGTAVVFAGVAHAACTDCHTDPHAGALGPDCTSCHTTADWREVLGGGFDHARTRYPLEGRHAEVACSGCHGERGPRPAFSRCADCHRYDHRGRSGDPVAWRDCERCHAVGGFRPARFALADHDTTAFPLRGAHRATPCEFCHRPSARTESGQPARVVLDPAAGACTACHTDPHRWTVTSPPACTVCHTEDSWRAPTFDHAATTFPLTGRHEAVRCGACHRTGESAPLHFGGESPQCAACHRDVHEGTMTRRDGESEGGDCKRCHVTTDWLAENFDHDRDSRFALAGAHVGVDCRACHTAAPDAVLRIFRPLVTDCVSCHPALPAAEEES